MDMYSAYYIMKTHQILASAFECTDHPNWTANLQGLESYKSLLSQEFLDIQNKHVYQQMYQDT